MGNIQTRPDLPDKKAFHILDYGYCRVWKRRIDQLQTMEEYHLAIESEQRLRLFENVWPLRTNHNIFVNVYHFSHNKTSNFCGQVARGSLFTQRIPHRLSEFANVKYPEIMSIMKSCIEGYRIFFQHYGLFIVRSTMIGFTDSFQTKIWFHTDFSEPEPQNPNCKNLHEMYASLISAVQSACEHLYYNCPKFSQYIVQTNYIYFSKDFNWLLKGLETYCQKFGIAPAQNLRGIKGFVKQPEGWEKFKAKKAYPKVIPTETDIDSAKTISDSTKFYTSQQTTAKIPVPQSYFSKRQVPKNTPLQHPSIIAPQLKRNFSSQVFGNQTSDRVLFESFVIEPQKANENCNRNTYSSTIQKKYISRPEIARREEIKFWRSSEKFNINQTQTQTQTNDKRLISSVSMSRFKSPPNKIIFKPFSNNYQSSDPHEIKEISSKRASETRSNQNFNFGGKSFDMTTDTRNRDKSAKEQFSLIEDLEVEAKIPETPMRQIKFN